MPTSAEALFDERRDHVPLLMKTLLNRGAKVQPENEIITKTSSDYSVLTFREYQAQTQRLANTLTSWGFQLGDRIGTLMWNNVWHLQCTHAIGCIGAVIHTLNARLSPQDLSFILKDAGDRLIFVDGVLLELLGRIDRNATEIVELIVCCGIDGSPGAWVAPQTLASAQIDDYHGFLNRGSDRFDWPIFSESSPYYLCYTSGSTSTPKGVVYSHRSMYLAIMTMGLTDQYGISGSMVVCPFVPMFHIFSWGVPLLTLMLGARTVFTNQFTKSEDFLNLMLTWEVEWTAGVPPVWQMLRDNIQKMGVDSVRQKLRLCQVLSGGSAPSPEVMEWYHSTLGVTFMQGWGMTETNPLGTNAKYINTYRDRSKSMTEQHGNLSRAGVPVPGFQFRIADPNDLDRDMPPGEAGELLCKGTLVITKYYPEESPDKFHRGWLITGDVAFFDAAGEIVIRDRTKDFIKSGGEWISSISLESHIASIEGVHLVAVIGISHPRWDERPVAIVSLTLSSQSGPGHIWAMQSHQITEHVRSHCAKTFAKFQLPDDVLVWESIPLNSTGKVDKKQIREQLASEGYVLPDLRIPRQKL